MPIPNDADSLSIYSEVFEGKVCNFSIWTNFSFLKRYNRDKEPFGLPVATGERAKFGMARD